MRLALNSLYPTTNEKRKGVATKSPGKAKKPHVCSPQSPRWSTCIVKKKQSQLFAEEFSEDETVQSNTECELEQQLQETMNVVQERVELDQTSHIQTQLEESDGATNTHHSDTEAVAFEVGVTVGEVVHTVQTNVWTVPTPEE